MNSNSHTVTVPIKDYNEMKSALEAADKIKEYATMHMHMMAEELGRAAGHRATKLPELDITKEPIACQHTNGMAGYEHSIYFVYKEEVKNG